MLARLAAFSLVLLAGAFAADPLPADFEAALKSFRAEGTKGWSFVQSTASEKKSLVEHYDASKPEFSRWTLLKKDGRAPTEDELKEYNEKQTRRSRGDTAPDVTKQLDYATAERLSDDTERCAYRFHLKAGDKQDTTARFMVSTFTYHKPTHTIEKVELSNTEPFSPMFLVKIEEARTTIHYMLPDAERPTLLDHIEVRVRGRAMIFRSLDEDLTVKYSDYTYAGKTRPTPAAPQSK
ncbi:hypothetical protein DB347_10215 [Opitutaceae bacterium EW11]|nr:hypothetical protein DB347_10215 [Opitutaceae bacterium EW11]